MLQTGLLLKGVHRQRQERRIFDWLFRGLFGPPIFFGGLFLRTGAEKSDALSDGFLDFCSSAFLLFINCPMDPQQVWQKVFLSIARLIVVTAMRTL